MMKLRALRLALGAAPCLAAAGAAVAQNAPLTTAERSGFTATSRHADVMAFIAELQRPPPCVRLERMSTTAEGRGPTGPTWGCPTCCAWAGNHPAKIRSTAPSCDAPATTQPLQGRS